jgi:hypothetical protein
MINSGVAIGRQAFSDNASGQIFTRWSQSSHSRMSRDGRSWTCWSVTFFHSSFVGTRSPRRTMFVFCSWNMADVKGN